MLPSMQTKDKLNDGFARLQAIRYSSLGAGKPNEALPGLMQEYFERMRQWANALQTGEASWYQNLACFIEPSVQLPGMMREWLEAIRPDIQPQRGSHYVVQILCNYLCWCDLDDANLSRLPNLPEPYEPFIQLLEQGGGVYVEHGTLMEIFPNSVIFMLRSIITS